MGEYPYDANLKVYSRKRVRVLFGCVWAFLVLAFIVGATGHYLATTGRLDGFELAERWRTVLSEWQRPVSREIEEQQKTTADQPYYWVEPPSEIDRLLIERTKPDASGFAPSDLVEAQMPDIAKSPDMVVVSADEEIIAARYDTAGGAIINLEKTAVAISAKDVEALELSAGLERTPRAKAAVTDEFPVEAIDRARMADSAGLTEASDLVNEAPSGEGTVENVGNRAERIEAASSLSVEKLVHASDNATTDMIVETSVVDTAAEGSRIAIRFVSGEIAEAADAEGSEGPAAFLESNTSAGGEGEAEPLILASPSIVVREDLQERQHREIAAPETTDQRVQPAEDLARLPVMLTAEQQFDLDRLLARGDQYLAFGDVASARLFYQLAAKNGSGKAAAAMGATYDPVYIQRSGIMGTWSNPELAIDWYRRAIAMESSTAGASLRELTAHLERAAAFGNADARQILEKLGR